MTVTALVSGGKDSVFSAYLADTQGWEVDEVLVVRPADPESMLFHTPNLGMVRLQAEAWGKRYREVPAEDRGEAGETAALRTALSGASGPVVAGAIASSFQWSRLGRLTFELGRPLYTPLWGKDAERVVQAEIEAGLDIRLVHLAADSLGADLLGRRLDPELLATLRERGAGRAGVHIAGEGGEFETLVVDAPFFSARLAIDEAAPLLRPGTSTLKIGRAHLQPKEPRSPEGL